jgi:hypothetical protein
MDYICRGVAGGGSGAVSSGGKVSDHLNITDEEV